MAFTLAHCVTMTSALTGLVNINERCVNMTPRELEDICRRRETLLTDTIKLGKVKFKFIRDYSVLFMSNILIKHASSLFQVKSPPKFRDLENRTAVSRILKEKEKKLSTGESSKLAITGWPRLRENREFGSYFFQTGKTQGILF